MAEDLDGRRRAAAELGADIAHEFKNPLATIAASAELLVDVAGADARARRPGGAFDRRIGRAPAPIDRRSDGAAAAGARDRRRGARADRDGRVPGRRSPTSTGAIPRASGWTFTVDVTPEAAAAAPVINRRRWQEMLRNLVDNALVQPATERRIVLGARLRQALAGHVRPRRGPRHLAREPGQDLPPLLHAAPAGRAARDGTGPVDRGERRARSRRAGRRRIASGAGRDVPG